MSVLGLAATGGGAIASILLRRPRAIGTIIPDVVVEEVHNDELVITDHPVEQGAAISDHAYKRPSEVIVKCAWSNSSSVSIGGFAIPGVSRGALATISSFGERDYVTSAYKELLELQKSRKPFDLITGKARYPNMLIASLGVTTDQESEEALMVVARLRQVIIVQTQSTNIPPKDQQRAPEETAAPEQRGTVQPQTPAPSVLQQIGSFFGL